MNDLEVTIEQRILRLARETEAPPTFIEQVRTLFLSKGISLDADAAPYDSALREAFRRELAIRRSTLRARKAPGNLQTRLRSLGEGYRKEIEGLRERQNKLDRRARGVSSGIRALRHGPTSAAGSDDPAGATPLQRDILPMVPGPEGAQ